MCLNTVNRLRENLLPGYQSIKRHYEFSEYFILDCDQLSYFWNVQIHTSLGHSLLVTMTNYTCVKLPMEPKTYKVVSTHDYEISGCTILYILLHSLAPHLGGMNGDVQSDLSDLAFKNGEKLEDFHIIILILQ